MTEKEWNSCIDPQWMLEFLRGKVSDRKLRLFAVACCRRLAHMLVPQAREGVELAERVAEGMADSTERKQGRERGLQAGWLMDDSFRARRGPAKAAVCDALGRQAYRAASRVAWRTRSLVEGHCQLLRELFCPIRPTVVDPGWLTPTVVWLAQVAYDRRLMPDGELDAAVLAVLADALEEAGAGGDILEHLRGPGPHVRGCHALDALLGKA